MIKRIASDTNNMFNLAKWIDLDIRLSGVQIRVTSHGHRCSSERVLVYLFKLNRFGIINRVRDRCACIKFHIYIVEPINKL